MRRFVFVFVLSLLFLASGSSTDNIEEQIRFLSLEDQFDYLYKLSVELYFKDCSRSIRYGNIALQKAEQCSQKNKLLLAYYNLATAYSINKDYEQAGTYLNLFNNNLKQENQLYDEFILANIKYDDKTKYNIIRNQLEGILHNKEFQELELANKDLFIQNQKNIQKYYLIILVLFILFTVTSYRQWHLVRKTNKKLNSTIKELNHANYKLEQIARTDPLTKISNRRDMIDKIESEKKRFSRNGKPFVLIMADIDNFKNVNDKFGHDAGDFILQSVSHLMRSSMREQDVLGRWGGEEFLMLLPETDLEGGYLLAQKILKNVSHTPYIFGSHSISITLTFGVAVYDVFQDIEHCIRRADEAMYEGKNSGKNCVAVATQEFYSK